MEDVGAKLPTEGAKAPSSELTDKEKVVKEVYEDHEGFRANAIIQNAWAG